jgi:CheY-like chemotaxis protein
MNYQTTSPKTNILLIEDNPGDALLIREMLEESVAHQIFEICRSYGCKQQSESSGAF